MVVGRRYYRGELDEEDDASKPKGFFAQLLDEKDEEEEGRAQVAPTRRAKTVRFAESPAQGTGGLEAPSTRQGSGGGGDAASGLEEGARKRGREETESADPRPKGRERTKSLLVKTVQARRNQKPETPAERQWREEQEILRNIEKQRMELKSAKELAQDIEYARTDTVDYNWTPPKWWSEAMSDRDKLEKTRKKLHIIAEGTDVVPPCETFQKMKLPKWLVDHLEGRGIVRPTPIQMQGIPVAFSGRDMIGVAFTGSGKTLAFSIPSVFTALIEDYRMPIRSGEGPVALVICPSRELARQTYQVLNGFVEAFNDCRDEKQLCERGTKEEQVAMRKIILKTMLCIGGVDLKEQTDVVRREGVHIIVATPGRLKDHLSKKRITLDACRYIVLDEADRMIDMGFEEDVREILSYFKSQRQTMLFSATMPEKIRSFANKSLVDPVIVNVGRAGAANLDVIQEVEYVKQDSKMVHILQCLQKTAPPVMVFCENKNDVDAVHEYLLLKGVDACAVHGGLDQEVREKSIDAFKNETKDVLVATDVASKGLDFANIQHVINYDMPGEIENYVHRIGRTGRCGKTGVATTFVNHQDCSESSLLDLKHLLKEAKQRIPPILNALDDPQEMEEELAIISGIRGCAYCGGLGHRVTMCPKLIAQDREISRRSAGGGGEMAGYGGEM
ncbi:DEAD-box ATP-dependent RNA helicase [Chloropicon primus]|uniref:RNA helicase n=2 Tax=Chloropicon primus TaxID=1764295 RepID=A0A5B8MEG0_9CHLO|nr:DEAD-box ATP-dependent RNA helicase [Chloropicon primus]UPQ97859.1 DEAD-box ATP-dependent RNA helicase [Chloropicon primus]|eukprot:QDZ18651.1 DEAD-box ATP-dependent RNA helicase [Chloropicon primus]